LGEEFETMESHCGQIEYVPKGWTLLITQGSGGKTKTQCMRRDDRPIYAAQFHIEMKGTPESSRQIMANFLGVAQDWGGFNPHATPLAKPKPLANPGASN
jgi:GMP synthase-like glutamine amidotransferase